MMGLTFWVLPVVVFLLLAVRYRQKQVKSQGSVDTAIEIHKARLAELQDQHQQGGLSAEEYESFKLEEEKALLADAEVSQQQRDRSVQLPWIWVPLLTVTIFGAAFLIYYFVGAADAVNVRTQFTQLQASGSDFKPEQVTEALDSYKSLLEKNPTDIEGWFRLARMQMDMQEHDSSIASFNHVLVEIRKVEHQAEDEAAILNYIGQSQMALGRYPEAMASFEESLQYYQLDAALGFAGRIAFEQGDFKKSIDYWNQLILRNQDGDTSAIDDLIDRAKKELAAQGIDYEAEQPLHIIVNIELPSAWEGLADEAALFVYARLPGQRMPLAVKRMKVTGKNMSVMLSDADAMGPMGGLTGQAEVEVTARVSLTGVANTQAGDWSGDSKVITLDQKENEATIVIEQP